VTRGRARASALLGAALLSGACHDYERASHDFERMRQQQKYELYGASGIFPDGKAMQAPPAGTVARAATLQDGATDAQGAPVAEVPFAVTPELLAVGDDRFAIHCAVCHGVAGHGGSIVAANMGPPRPPSLHEPSARGRSAGALHQIVVQGIGRMPPYAAALSARERWAVVAWVQHLQRVPRTDSLWVQDSLAGARLAALDSQSPAP